MGNLSPRKLCWRGCHSFLCSSHKLHIKGGQQAVVGEVQRPSRVRSLIPSLSSSPATLVPVLIVRVGHELSLGVGG